MSVTWLALKAANPTTANQMVRGPEKDNDPESQLANSFGRQTERADDQHGSRGKLQHGEHDSQDGGVLVRAEQPAQTPGHFFHRRIEVDEGLNSGQQEEKPDGHRKKDGRGRRAGFLGHNHS